MEKDRQDMNPNYPELMSKYLSGNASSAETRELEEWVVADPDNKQQFMAFKKAWILAGMKETSQSLDINHLWEDTARQLWEPETKVVNITEKKKSFRLWWSLAAAVIVLLVVSVIILFQFQGEAPMTAQALEEVEKVKLPDGSHITLNQSSTITYVPEKETAIRKIALKGDAFFDVERDEKRPFIIETEGIEIEVLGTSFYVDARDDQSEVQVVVASGVVAVRSGVYADTLRANEKAIFLKSTGQLSKQVNDDVNFQSVKTNILTFDNTSLDEVVFVLNRQFKANIRIENETLLNCPLTAIYQQKSLNSILTILEASIGVQHREEEGGIILYGSCSSN